MRRRKKKRDDEHIDESWLIPYADILTLLLALFIVLYASSSVDAQKFQELSKVFNEIFTDGSGIMQNDAPILEKQVPVEEKEDSEKIKEDTKEAAAKRDQEELKEIQSKINQYIKRNNLEDQFATKLTSEGLLLTIRDNVLFASGSATVGESDIAVAMELSQLLEMDPPRNVIISGHTDNVPIATAEFDSNWELSVMRAVNFMKIIIKNENLDPRWFSAKGFGEFQPIASNDTASGRSQNRRVEVLILPREL
ncbi:chemotaxis protein MotB [Bacillus pakistanensis]|uniref:Chemotaxis protein MotB n=2 Tax=Rossellomorea pakistanensis TaxID=992288 RepID=A0ABS2NJG4_9BACI|nr:flagellar motor protein MotB [Bacillus pakistanensis]MBM7587975.1 chemotaxis protein MotB [Bacillus pakistanensis]